MHGGSPEGRGWMTATPEDRRTAWVLRPTGHCRRSCRMCAVVAAGLATPSATSRSAVSQACPACLADGRIRTSVIEWAGASVADEDVLGAGELVDAGAAALAAEAALLVAAERH